MTIDFELAMERIKDPGLLDALDSLHMAMHRKSWRRQAKEAQGWRHMELSQPSEEDELWARR